MLDTYRAGSVSFDGFRPLEGAQERRRAAAAAAAEAAAVFTTVCSLLETVIAACERGGPGVAGAGGGRLAG
jgi:hypothetical protein